METDLALATGRAVAFMSISMEWLTLKAAISMTTPGDGCACPTMVYSLFAVCVLAELGEFCAESNPLM